MTQSTQTYQLSQLSGALLHVARKFWLVRDVDEPVERERLKAHIQSGDYFGMLATELDEISQVINDLNEAQSIVLQQVINDLLFLERNYQIKPKESANKP